MVIDVRDGLIAHRTDYWDSLTFLRQTGDAVTSTIGVFGVFGMIGATNVVTATKESETHSLSAVLRHPGRVWKRLLTVEYSIGPPR